MDSNITRRKELLFPTPIFIVDFNEIDFCSRAARAVKAIQLSGEGVADPLCYTSPDDLHLRPEFQELVNIVMPEMGRVFDDIGLIRDDYYITCMWANVSKPHNRHALHPHANSYFSGVIYLEAPGEPGNIGFRDPRPAADVLSFDYEDTGIFKNRTIGVQPYVGRLVMFPSWLYHGTKSGQFDENLDRISLAFNVLPRSNVQEFSRKISL